jgi:hypothetical protein
MRSPSGAIFRGVFMPISEAIGKSDRIWASHYLATLARDHGIFLEIQGSM